MRKKRTGTLTYWKYAETKSFMNRIVDMADYFGVSFEYLLRGADEADKREKELVEMFRLLDETEKNIVIRRIKGLLEHENEQ